MPARTLLLLILMATIGPLGCTSAGDCPITTVILDAGTATDALPTVGEYGSCEAFCPPTLPVCRRVKDLVLTCQPGCV